MAIPDETAKKLILGTLQADLAMRPGKLVVTIEKQSFTFVRPEEFVGPVRRVQHESWQIGGKEAVLDYQRFTFGGRVIYDISDDIKRRMEDATEDCDEYMNAAAYLPLSLVGNVISFESIESGSGACGPPSFFAGVHAVDGITGKPALLTDCFEEDSVLAALRGDRFLHGMKKVKTLSDAEKHIPKLFYDGPWNHFALLGYDEKSDFAEVRFAVGGDLRPFEQLGLRLKPKAAFRSALKEAVRGNGFFMDRYTVDGKRDSLGAYVAREGTRSKD
jgi:hypothetical protein